LVGEILAGIAVGPHGMNIAPKPDALMMVGEFGLVLMVLEAGVEVDLASLSLVGARGVQVAFFGSLVPLAIGATLSKLVFDMSAKTCLAVGASLAPTSMGISLKVLQDGGVLGTPTGQLIIAAAVMDDVIALVLLSELEALRDPTPVNFIVPIVSSLCFIVFVGYLAVRVVPDLLVKRLVPRVPKKHLEGVLLGMVFVVSYFMMVSTHYGRSSHLLGAFLGGLCFCSLSSVQHVWHREVEKILSWLIRVFFACTIGFEVPIRDLWTGPVLARAAVFMIAAFGKIATGLFARPLTAVEASKIGFAMSAWGEFAFIVATASRSAGTLGHEEFSAVILCARRSRRRSGRRVWAKTANGP
jgi:Kef-type K+ transport system membrane component KefB